MTASSLRPRNAQGTRETILAAARHLFAAESYEAVGMRDVARAAGINVALVARYFGSKQELFGRVLMEREGEDWFGGESDPAAIAAWLTKLALSDGADEYRADLERLLIILRSASSPGPARLIADAFVAQVFAPLAARLDPSDGPGHAEVRAGLALILVIGTTVLNGVLAVEPIGPDLREEGRRRLEAMIAAALTGAPLA